MALQKLQVKPGVNKEGTDYSAGGTWYDCDKVRFRFGRPEQIGGWVKYTNATYKGVCRSLRDWATTGGNKYLGIGTSVKFYVEMGGTIYDITPIRLTTAAGDVTFSATNGLSTIDVSEVSHGAVEGDYVTFSGAVSLGGLIVADVLNQEYVIDSITDSDTFVISAVDTNGDPVVANASDTGNGGASTVGAYQISVGTNYYVSGSGYSAGLYSAGTYGGVTTIGVTNQIRLYSQDTFGDDLIFNTKGGGVYYWDESAGTGTRGVDLSALAGASDTPTACYQIMVSDVDRHVIAFGCNPLGSADIDPLLVRWSDQENAADWTPTATNSAGGTVLSSGGAIIGAYKTRREILIFTEFAIHSMRFTGKNFVYDFTPIAENVSMLSPNAAVASGDVVYFMDRDGFYLYNGTVKRLPCTLYDHVFDNLVTAQVYKVFAALGQDDTEVTWYYPVGDDSADVTNYVTYNFGEGVWTHGTLARGAWIHAGTKSNPIASSAIPTTLAEPNYLYSHEVGYDADGSPMNSYIESGGIEIAEGEQFMFIRKLLADFRFDGNANAADITITINGRKTPLDDFAVLDTAEITSTTRQSHIRGRAREVSVKIEAGGMGYGWTAGDMRLDIRTDGRR